MVKHDKRLEEKELLSKFSDEFKYKVNKSHIANFAFRSLLYGVDVYTVLENIIDIADKSNRLYVDFVKLCGTPTPIIISKEQYENIKRNIEVT